MIAARNSSYKLDDKSADYYNALRAQEAAKEARARAFEKSELDKYRVKKAPKPKTPKMPAIEVAPTIKIRRKPAGVAAAAAPAGGLAAIAYSSDDE
jgi:ferric-dicitrate binding protein FerR (iron transport regulator)